MTRNMIPALSGAAVFVAALAVVACSGKATESKPSTAQSSARSDPAPKAEVGQSAPDFEVRDEAGNLVRLADHRGKQPVLLAFYPKDFTSG
jgi:cytochrome oxidase Cu insertion factor (SCO1/SenC/PrrC family)